MSGVGITRSAKYTPIKNKIIIDDADKASIQAL
jgi:hypothetical protein